MSDPAIYIAFRGTTHHVRPRYIRPRPPAPAIRGPQPYGAVFRISHTPYGIRNSEFGNRDSGTGDSGNHGAVEWATSIHLGLMNSMNCLLSGCSDLA